MIRFIDLGEQVSEGDRQFAWFDTVSDTFLSFGHSQVFDTVTEFKELFYQDSYYKDCDIERFISLIPLEWNK